MGTNFTESNKERNNIVIAIFEIFDSTKKIISQFWYIINIFVDCIVILKECVGVTLLMYRRSIYKK